MNYLSAENWRKAPILEKDMVTYAYYNLGLTMSTWGHLGELINEYSK